MDPYAIALIVVVVVLVSVGLGVGGYAQRGKVGGIASGFGSVFGSIFNFIPLSLILFGFLADMFAQTFKMSIASIIGIISIILNKPAGDFIAKLVGGQPPMTGGGEPWCTIPGLSFIESYGSPMIVTSTASIMTYYLIDAGIERQSLGMMIGLTALYVAQLVTMFAGGCLEYYFNKFGAIAISTVLGITFGSIGYGIVSSVAPNYLPFRFSNISSGSSLQTPLNSGGLSSTGPTSGGQCSAAQGDDAYVCEAYKNGQLVTETISS